MSRLGTENKKTPKARTSPTSANLHWAAGFLEGEGCFTLCGDSIAQSLSVTATQVQQEPLERLVSYFGGSILPHGRSGKGRDGKIRQQAYRWHATGSRARGIMLTLYPLMSPRRQARIEEVVRKNCISNRVVIHNNNSPIGGSYA